MRPLAAYKAAQRAINGYCRGNDTDPAALEALAACVSSLEAQHEAIRRRLATVAPWRAADGKAADAADADNSGGSGGGGGGSGSGGNGGGNDAQQIAAAKRLRRTGGGEPQAAADAAAAETDKVSCPLVEHSFDLSLAEEPAFLAASALLSLGLLREARGELLAAVAALDAALALFPGFIAAHVAAARLELADAGSQADMATVERHLAAAVSGAKTLAAAEDGLVVESNKACAKELAAGDDARRALAMLLCQSGRDAEAAQILEELGFSWRLARCVLAYPLTPPLESVAGGCGEGAHVPLAVLDNALPAPMLQRLQAAFSPNAAFWGAHGYGPRQGYFSYAFSLDASPASSLLAQLAHHLRAVALPHFPEVAKARYAEWWAHCRRHCSGHQLHFDSDDEGVGGVRNPIISSVVYLSSLSSSSSSTATAASGSASAAVTAVVGGPTLVTDQRLGGELATEGWLAYPAINRVTMFDGRVLHGVIPGRGPSPSPSLRRCTLMVAFWRELKIRELCNGQLGASMPMPAVPDASSVEAAPSSSWLHALMPLGVTQGSDAAFAAPKLVPPVPAPAIWEPIAEKSSKKAPSYNACFQGF